MDSQYYPFNSANGGLDADGGIRQRTVFSGLKAVLKYVFYAVLVLLLLALLTVIGVKFSQLNKEITDVKLQLKTIGSKGPTSLSASGSKPATEALLERLVPTRGTCRQGWGNFQGRCYLLSTATATWQRAEDQCKTLGGHLLVLNNEEELDYISRIVEIKYHYWIGLVERQHEGEWSWVDGTDYDSTPKFWDQGQPDNWAFRENGEDCGQLHGSLKRKLKLWNDADCSLLYRYICEATA
ncbi:hepatic lectin isoform X1 [Fundulus heteroclitus]|uniref:hepatic lectin isoform X1 n=1 Tax=Fundulus heteroclitus TaxID=8078 RepID=UPI00165A28B4|nr:hepatic lectin isoform X1 [Fundulus heteroclitus]